MPKVPPAAGRLALTVLVPLAAVVAARFPTPGLDLDVVRGLDAGDLGKLGPFAFWLSPFIAAALLVELHAVLVPRWRSLRHAGYQGRSVLFARTKALCFALASIQAFFFYRWLDRTGAMVGPLLPEATMPRLLIGVAPIAGTMVLVWLAGIISRHGLANGFSVLIVAFQLPTVAEEVMFSVQDVASGRRPLAPLAFTGMLVVAAAVSIARRPSHGWGERPPRPQLLTPASGIIPIIIVSNLLLMPSQLQTFGLAKGLTLPAPGSLVDALVQLPMIVGLCLLLAWAFNRPAAMAAAWKLSAEDAPIARSALRQGIRRALFFVGAVAVMRFYADRSDVLVDALALIVLACVALDVVAEVRFRYRYPDLVPLCPIHRMYMVGTTLHALTRAAVPAHPRALRHATLLNVWGPYVPVEILVPRAEAEPAQAVLRELQAETTPS
jgi:hypothetical protein